MRTITLGLIIFLSLSLIACGGKLPPGIETTPAEDLSKYAHIELVRLYIDGYLCDRCGSELERVLAPEEGVKDIVPVTEKAMIELSAKTGAFLDLYDIKQRVNGTRTFTVRRMEVIVTGTIQTFGVPHFWSSPDPHPHERYRLLVGKTDDEAFILSEGAKLDELLATGYERVIVVGVLSGFSAKTPVLAIKGFAQLKEAG
jgi:hypothetical protein